MTRLADELTRSWAELTLADEAGAPARVLIEQVRADGSMSLQLDAIPEGLALRPGERVVIECPVPGACYRIETTLMRLAQTVAARFALVTAAPHSLARQQRRAFFRARIECVARLRPSSTVDDAPWTTVPVYNLSAGGAALTSGETFEPGAAIDVVLELPDGPPLATAARVVRTEAPRAPRDVARVLVRFVDLPPTAEDRLVRLAIRAEQGRLPAAAKLESLPPDATVRRR